MPSFLSDTGPDSTLDINIRTNKSCEMLLPATKFRRYMHKS